MIISASRRTDIPAFYTEWFLDKLKAGWMIVVNPFNANQANLVPLNKNDVECYVFWSKNPKPLLDRMDELIDLIGPDSFYFQFTLNGYGPTVEPKLPSLNERIATFKALSERIGAERVIWRYDPVLLTERFTKEWHMESFDYLAEKLHPFTKKCVFSFVDPYKKTVRNTENLNIGNPNEYPMEEIAESFSKTARKYNLELSTCCEAIDLEKYGITHNRCIDDVLIEKITEKKVCSERDNQREHCGCIKCKDIGANDTCLHHCLYCYANRNPEIADNLKIDPTSPLLGSLGDRTIFNGKDGNLKLYYEKKIIIDLDNWVESRKKPSKQTQQTLL